MSVGRAAARKHPEGDDDGTGGRSSCRDVRSTGGRKVLGGSEGLAILSRFRLQDVRVDDLPESEPPRRMLSPDLTKRGSSIRVVCAPTVAVSDGARRHQVAAVLTRAEEQVMIGGDLDAPPEEILP